MRISRTTQDKLWRLLLRWIPLIPAPEIYDLIRDVKRSQDDVDEQVTEALDSIRKTSKLVGQLEDSLKERAMRLEELQKEHERYSQLVEMEADKAQALLRQIEATLGKNIGRERWIAFGINLAAGLILFVLGVVLSDYLRHVWALLTK